MPIWFQSIDLETLNRWSGRGLNERMGMVFTEIGDDYLRSRTPVDERSTQPMGLWHGGASCVVSEAMGSTGCSLCLDQARQYCVGVDINASHLRSATSGHVRAEARPLKLGRTMHVWETRLWNDNDKLVCVSRLATSIIDRA